MSNSVTKKKNLAIYIIVIIIIIAIVGVGLYFVLGQDTTETSNTNNLNNSTSTSGEALGKNIKEEVITAENYEEILNRIENEISEDDEDIYYLSYAMMYYMFSSGISSAVAGNDVETEMYSEIYGKTIQQLIDEGKQLMEENDVPLEEYKESLTNLNNTVN